MVKNLPASVGDAGSVPGLGRSPGEGKENPFQYSCLRNPMDRGAWRATVLEVARVGHDLVTKTAALGLISDLPGECGRGRGGAGGVSTDERSSFAFLGLVETSDASTHPVYPGGSH